MDQGLIRINNHQLFLFLNVNHICGGQIKLVNPLLIDMNQAPSLDICLEDETLIEFLGIYNDLPKFHHKRQKTYCLTMDAYSGEHDNYYSIPLLMDSLIRSDLLITKTIDIQMDENNHKKIIKIGKCFNQDEQKIQKMNPQIALLVKSKIKKLLDYGFIHPIDYFDWISNIVPISKGKNKIRMCTNFRDLNLVSLKDDFPLPNIDMIVD